MKQSHCIDNFEKAIMICMKSPQIWKLRHQKRYLDILNQTIFR